MDYVCVFEWVLVKLIFNEIDFDIYLYLNSIEFNCVRVCIHSDLTWCACKTA